MSRNRCSIGCAFCEGNIVLVEPPRAVTIEDTFPAYFDEYNGMVVANAECEQCKSKYLAWVQRKGSFGHLSNDRGAEFVDTSFRSTFDDEPGPDDLPDFVATATQVWEKSPWPVCSTCGVKVYRCYGCQCP